MYIASGSRDKTIRLCDTATHQCIFLLVSLLFPSFILSSNSSTPFTIETKINQEGHDNWVREVIFHPNGKHLMSVSDDKSIRVWDLQERRCIKIFNEAHSHFITCADFNSKDPHLATGSVDQDIKIWPCK